MNGNDDKSDTCMHESMTFNAYTYKEPDLTDMLELMNALDEVREKYNVSWDYLQQLTELVDDFFSEAWNNPPMILNTIDVEPEPDNRDQRIVDLENEIAFIKHLHNQVAEAEGE